MADFVIAEGLSLQGSPQFGVNLSAKVESNIAELEGDVKGIETLDIGVGIGAQYKLANNGLFFQTLYVAGLTDYIENIDASNSVVSVSVGYMFN